MISDFDKAHMKDILKDTAAARYDWFSCHLLRLIARADQNNRERLRLAFPQAVESYEEWFYQL